MPKYRLLTSDELHEFEKEFVEYLIANGIVAEDWEKIKKENPKEAQKIVDLFSDVVFEKVMRSVNFLDVKSENSLKSFQCLKDKIVLVALDADNVNLLDVKSFTELKNSTNTSVKIYTTEKKYSKQRELELFDMINAGAEISDGALFKNLALVLASKNN